MPQRTRPRRRLSEQDLGDIRVSRYRAMTEERIPLEQFLRQDGHELVGGTHQKRRQRNRRTP